MSRNHLQAASQSPSGRHFTEVAFAFAALAALAFALIVHHTALGASFTEEARSVVTWSFIGLAAFDAIVLMFWSALVRRIAQA